VVRRPSGIRIVVLDREPSDHLRSAAVHRRNGQLDLAVLKAKERQAFAVMAEVGGAQAFGKRTRSAAQGGYLPDGSVGFRCGRRVVNQRTRIWRPAGGKVVCCIPADRDWSATDR